MDKKLNFAVNLNSVNEAIGALSGAAGDVVGGAVGGVAGDAVGGAISGGATNVFYNYVIFQPICFKFCRKVDHTLRNDDLPPAQ